MMKEKYTTYRCTDFVSDQDFINWVNDPDPLSDEFWTSLAASYPRLEKEMNDARLIIQSIQFEEEDLPEEEKQLLWDTIRTGALRRSPIINRLKLWAACAASILLLFGVWLWYTGGSDQLMDFAESTSGIMFGSEIRVMLANKTDYIVASGNADFMYGKNGQLTINATETIDQPAPGKKRKTLFNRIIVPWGKRSTITFADGTRLWLNSGSRAVFPVDFTSDNREILIEGEAYFEVAKDRSRPFIVKADGMKVKVLGTAFNITAYPEENDMFVTLVTGSVEVGSKGNRKTIMQPDHMIRIDKNIPGLEVSMVDVYDYICWKDGFLHFRSETLENILRRIERHYAVPIVMDDQLSEYTISGKLDLKERVEKVLDVIKMLAPVEYEIKNNKILISKK
ncbi:MAG: DUF4974 domain-containing protein [Bacteroidales bacterium]|nr:DUF4974 domain-containing protein [Bacteroidales bacterium]